MGLIHEILKELEKTSLNYKGIRVNLLGIPKFKNSSKNTFSSSISYLRRKRLVDDTGQDLIITRRGREYLKRKQNSLNQFHFKFKKDALKNLLVMFDIPETKKAEREWLRWHLKKFDYRMIQKSVWVGPSPLPPDFLLYLEKIKIKDCFKTFKLAKDYNFKK